jgi:subtilisin family serine protease
MDQPSTDKKCEPPPLRTALVLLAAATLALTGGCNGPGVGDGSRGEPGLTPPEQADEEAASAAPPLDARPEAKIPASILAAVAAGEERDVLVVLDDRALESRAMLHQGADGAPASADLRAAVRAAAFAAAKQDVLAALPAREIEVRREYSHLPILFLRVKSEPALLGLAERNEVVSLHEDEQHERFLTQSLPLIDQPEAYAAGKDGSGATVAVLDTGVDYTRAAFGSCSSPSASCKVVYAADFAPDDGARDANGHGTNVAGIVLGVAPAAKIAALDVFAGDSGSSSDILAGINWVIANRSTYNIVAMNLSLGGGSYTAQCPNSVFASAVTSAKAAGVLSAIATGNNGYTDKVAAPACVPDAVSVGAVYDENVGGLAWSGCSDSTTAADKVTCFSNSASFITMLAPGAMITAAGLQMGGTSQATPHVAGAIAVLRAAFPDETPDQTIARLTGSGVSVTDARNGVVKPRLDLNAATEGCALSVTPSSFEVASAGESGAISVTTGEGCEWSASSDSSWLTLSSGTSGSGSGTVAFTAAALSGGPRTGTITVGSRSISVVQGVDTTAPTGSVTIEGDALAVKQTAVTLGLTASDAGGVTDMCISNSTSCSSWQAYAASPSWTLSAGEGTKTVRLWLRDAAGNTSAVASDTILLDTSAPKDGTVSIAPSSGQNVLSWSGFSDARSGIGSYKVVASSSAAPASCGTGTVVYAGAETSYTHSSLTNGTTYHYRVCALDRAANVSPGATKSATPAPEFDAPTGTVTINDGATFAATTSVTLTLAASDVSAVSAMCVSNTTSCSAWVPYVSSKSWSLAAGNGVKTVRVWLRDPWGNTSSTPLSDTISLDGAAPTGGALTATPGDAQVSLSWSGFVDPNSGVASYKVVSSTAAAPASCAAGTEVYTGVEKAFTHTGLANGTTYYYRACAVDGASNVSSGVTKSAKPAPELEPPTGTVVVNDDAAYTKSANVTLALSATDASGVSQVCVSNDATCTAWKSYATTSAWTLSAADGAKTVRVFFRDTWGNTSAAATDSIVLDATAPKGGALTATPGSGQVALSWSGFSDATSGVASYKVVAANGATAPATCSTGTLVYSGTSTSTVETGLTNGVARSYRVCALDAAGNVSAGVARKAIPAN